MAAGVGDHVQVQVAYAIGIPAPVSVRIRAYRGPKIREIGLAILGPVSLTPGAIIDRFGLRRPIFQETAAGGHFGKEHVANTFAWERLDLAESLRRSVSEE